MSPEENYQRLDVVCEAYGQQTAGFVLRRDLSKRERVTRSLRMLAIFWAVMFITVFVPMLHFVLVPLFFVLGLVFGFTTWVETGEILRGEVVCPSCGFKMPIGKESEDWPREPRCGGCSCVLKIAPASAAR